MAQHSPSASESVVAGLVDEITITTDEWGIPHVVASNAADAFFGQGYAQARLRLFQIDLWRRRGLGLIAEVLGAQFVELDIAARTFLVEDSDEQWTAYPASTRGRIESFVAGINAWVTEALADPALRPPEFDVVGYPPSLWSPSDLLRIRIHGLSSNAEQEVERTITLIEHGTEIERLRRLLEPAHDVDLAALAGFDSSVIDESLLEVYNNAHVGASFGVPAPPVAADGSNNWAITGDRTRTGRPILASDPHRIMTFPSLRVLVHVSCPEFDFIGMQEPYIPGIVAGHNGRVAFGITIAPADLEDLYVYELHPTDDTLYRYGDGYLPFTTVVEEIPVAGQSPVRREVRFTRHGPVLRVDPVKRAAVALRAAWLQPGMTPYLAGVDMVDSENVDGYLRRLGGWGNPVLNHIVADVEGSIAWQVAGRVPDRPNWHGLLPVPGDGSHEWAGMRTAADLPRLIDPPQGWLRSANSHNLGEDPHFGGDPTSYEWYSGYRARRLASVLASSTDWTVESAAALQNDYLVEPAAEVIALLDQPFTGPDAEFARAELRAWDQRMTVDSRAAALFDRWLYTELPNGIRREAARRYAAHGRADAAASVLLDARLLTLGDPRIDLQLLAESVDWAPTATFTSTDDLIEATLAAAVTALRNQLGADVASWSWGAVHVSRLVHPLHRLPGTSTGQTDTGAHPKGGSSDTVGVSFGADGVQTLGAGTRVVIDVGDWDASIAVNSPGQDGSLGGAHSLDQYATWLADGYVPLLYTAERIAEHAESVHRLTPPSD